MITPELIAYIKAERAKGLDDKTIKATIVTQGWNAGDFEEAVLSIAGITRKASEQVTPELLKYRKDKKWFIFTILMIPPALYVMTIFGTNIQAMSSIFAGNGFIWVLIYVIGIGGTGYLSARIATAAMRPKNTKFNEVLNIIGNIVVAGVLAGIMFAGLFFVTCLVMIGAGGI